MSEAKFVVGQWVTCFGRPFRVKQITEQWMHADEGYSTTWANVEPFVWQVGKTYKTTLDGVVATIHTICNGRIGVSCGWSHVADPIMARMFHDGTGQLHDFETRTDVPHLLPYLADEPPPVAEAATYSEFAEADECDDVNHPPHYTQHPSGVECITITEAFNFNIGNAIKYLWRAGLKGDALEDLRKATWYVQREIERAKR